MIEKQFNMAEAREIADGKKLGSIKTRDGYDVTILHLSVRPSFPLAGIVHLGDDNDYVRQWTALGKGDIRPHVTMRSDLILEVEGGKA